MSRAAENERFLREAIRLAHEPSASGRFGPFGAVVVREGEIVGRGHNRVTEDHDPTAHAEIVALRDACRRLGTFSLAGCEMYASCEPCPMCLAAVYWARLDRLYYAATREDAAAAGFDDALIYVEFARPPHQRSLPAVQMLRDEALAALQHWAANERRIHY
jgi:tRNA(Arg) A34 adenosine deaminase TadA